MALNVTDVQKALKGADYPATKDDLAQRAQDNGAGDDVLEAIRRADADRFDSPADVMSAVKGSLGGA